MTMTGTLELMHHALWMMLMLSAPVLLVALAVGLTVGALQTATQLQDPVVGLAPRLVAVALTVLVALPWSMGHLVMYLTNLLQSIPDRL